MRTRKKTIGMLLMVYCVGLAHMLVAQLAPRDPSVEEAPAVPTGFDLSGTFRLLGTETVDAIKSFHLYHIESHEARWIKPGQWYKTYQMTRHDEGNNILVFERRKKPFILKIPHYLMGHRVECCIYERKAFLYALSQLDWRKGLFYDNPKSKRPFTGLRGTNHSSGYPSYRIKFESGKISSVKRWYHHGTRRTEEFYWDGERHGTWSTWNESGNLIELIEYAHDKVINKLDIQP